MIKFFAELKGATIKTSEGPRNFLLPICIGKPHDSQKGDLLKTTFETLSAKAPGIIYVIIVDSLYRFLPSHPEESEDTTLSRFEAAGAQWLRENVSIINEFNQKHRQKVSEDEDTDNLAFPTITQVDDRAIEQGPIVVIKWDTFLQHPEYRRCEAIIKEAFEKNAQDNSFAKEVLFEALPHTGERIKSWSRSSYSLEHEHKRDVTYLLEEAAVWLTWSLPQSNIHHVVHFQKGLSQTLSATNKYILSSDRSFHAPEYLQIKPKQQVNHQLSKGKISPTKAQTKTSMHIHPATPDTSLSPAELQALTEQHHQVLTALLTYGGLDSVLAIRITGELLTKTLETIRRKSPPPAPIAAAAEPAPASEKEKVLPRKQI
ncbi:MAG: hypothetical protein K0S08_603 [Gammaproteobacteria bacterium]|jgi:hypothetical protein|nr:hypothetical protein [Gammaproteobacteria bacterium]